MIKILLLTLLLPCSLFANDKGFHFFHDSPLNDLSVWNYALSEDGECIYTYESYQYSDKNREKVVDSKRCSGHIIARKIKEVVGVCPPKENRPQFLDENRVKKMSVDSDCLCTVEMQTACIDKGLEVSPMQSFEQAIYDSYYGTLQDCIALYPQEYRKEIEQIYSSN